MKQEYMTMRLSVENRANIIRRKSDGQSFGRGLIIRLHDGDVPENYEEVTPDPTPEDQVENNDE